MKLISNIAKNLLPLGIIFLLIGCSSYRNLPGTYYMQNISPNGITLTISPDSTFSMFGWLDIVGNDTVSGKWNTLGNILYLKTIRTLSDGLRVGDSISVIEKIEPNYNSIKIHVIDATDNTPFVGLTIHSNDDDVRNFSDASGLVTIDKVSSLKSLRLSYIGLQDTLEIKNPKSNDITIFIKQKKILRERWLTVQAKYLIKRNRIITLKKSGLPDSSGIFVRAKQLKQ